MNQVKTQIIQKLNTIVELIRHCATKALPTQDSTLMQEVTMAVVTHEGLCKLFEQDGPTENVVLLVNEFGRAVAGLYKNVTAFKPKATPLKMPHFSTKRSDKNLLN